MGYGKTLRERVPLIKFLVNAQKTVWYPLLFAVLCFVSGISNCSIYTPVIWVLCAFVVFSALFTDDNKVFIVPMLMVFYAIGQDEKNPFEMTTGNVLISFDKDAFSQIIICGVIAVSAFLVRMIADGSFKRAFSKRRAMTVGFCAFFVASMLNGINSAEYTNINLVYGLICGVVMLLFYVCVIGMPDNSDNLIPYACRSMVMTAYVALLQITVISLKAWSEHNFFDYSKAGEIISINRSHLILGWGLSTNIAAVFVLGIPAAMYLARNSKYNLLYFISALAFLGGALIINTRSASFVGMAAFIVCCAICCISGKRKISNRIYSACLILICGAFIAWILITVSNLEIVWGKFIDIMRLDNLLGNRTNLWKTGIDDFLASPIFGVGFDKGYLIGDAKPENFFSGMYHCIVAQIPASMGIVGCVAFVAHAFELLKLFFVKFSAPKFLLMMIPFMILVMSLVDNFFFYPNFQIFYGVFLALAERGQDQFIQHKKGASAPFCFFTRNVR